MPVHQMGDRTSGSSLAGKLFPPSLITSYVGRRPLLPQVATLCGRSTEYGASNLVKNRPRPANLRVGTTHERPEEGLDRWAWTLRSG